jgi:hypothetical protein
MSITNGLRPHSQGERNAAVFGAIGGGAAATFVIGPSLRYHHSDKVIDNLTGQLNRSLKQVAHGQVKAEDALGETIKNVKAWQEALPAIRTEAHTPITKLGVNALIGAAAGYVLIVGGKHAFDSIFN